MNKEPFENQEAKEPNEIYEDQLGDLVDKVEGAYVDANFRVSKSVGNDPHKEQMVLLLEDYSNKFGGFLKRAGLNLDLREFNEDSWIKDGDESEEMKHAKHMMINIEDRNKFVDFLREFGDYGLDNVKIIGLHKLALQISNQVKFFYNTDRADDDFLSLVPIFGEMSEQYKRIGELSGSGDLKQFEAEFKGYADAISGKYFKEHLKKKREEF